MATSSTPAPSATPTPVAQSPEELSLLQAIESFTLAGSQVIAGTHPVIAQDITVGLGIFSFVASLVDQLRKKKTTTTTGA